MRTPLTRLFFDTETSGLPLRSWLPETEVNNWPRMVQLAGAVYVDLELFTEFNFIIKPEGYVIPNDVAGIHGITTEIAIEKGKDLSFVLHEFVDCLNLSDQVIGHNIDFDCKVIGCELFRKKIENDLNIKPKICTMKAGTSHCNLYRKGRLKSPKLIELHQFLFNTGFEDAHDAMNDIRATVKCYFEMLKRGWIK
jgi:DNA polymerase III epsilon subunit-like protein